MKGFGKAALLSAVMLAALSGAAGAQAKRGRCDGDASGRGGCGDQGTDSSFSNKERDAANKTPLHTRANDNLVLPKATVSDAWFDWSYMQCIIGQHSTSKQAQPWLPPRMGLQLVAALANLLAGLTFELRVQYSNSTAGCSS